jgi:hypothetical protein
MDEKIDELLELTRENNKILRKMHRAQLWSGIFRFLYWATIIGTSIGLWYYFQPTIDNYIRTYQTLLNRVDSLTGSAGEGIGTISDLLNNPLIKRP